MYLKSLWSYFSGAVTRHPLASLLILALGVRLTTLGVSLLWYDEAFTMTMVHIPFLNALQAIRGDVHPPLWYLIDWISLRLIPNDVIALRLPAALFGVAGIAELYKLARLIAGDKPALWAGALMTLMPGQIYYSQEARMYSLLTFLVLMAARAIMDRNWLRWGLTLPLILLTQNTGITYVAVLGMWGLISSRGAALRPAIYGALSYGVWAPTALHQVSRVSAGFWLSFRPNIGAPLYMIPFTTVFTRLPQEFYLHGIIASLAVTGLALYGLRGKLRAAAPLLALTFLPPAALYLISFIWTPVLLDRALLPSGAAMLGLWGMGLSSYSGTARKLLAVFAGPIALIALVTYFTDPTGQRPSVDPISDTIRANYEPGDCLYHVTLESAILYDYYLPKYPAYVLPEAGDLAQSLTDETKSAIGLDKMAYPFNQLGALGCKRAFLFVVTNPVTSQYEIQQADYARALYPEIKSWTFLDTDISSFTLTLLNVQHGPRMAGGG